MKSSSVFDKAYSRLYKMILAGDVPAGERLLEIPLARQLQVSRTTVRNVLYRLKEDGLVDNPDGEGVRVRKISQQELRELIEFRILIECYCVRKLAAEHNHEILQSLEKCLVTQHKLRDRFRPELSNKEYSNVLNEYFLSDMGFHLNIVRSCGNATISDTSKRLYLLGNILVVHNGYQFYKDIMVPESGFNRLYEEHSKILQYIRDHDGDGAALVLQNHLDGMLRKIAEFNRNIKQEEKAPQSEVIDNIFNFLEERT